MMELTIFHGCFLDVFCSMDYHCATYESETLVVVLILRGDSGEDK